MKAFCSNFKVSKLKLRRQSEGYLYLALKKLLRSFRLYKGLHFCRFQLLTNRSNTSLKFSTACHIILKPWYTFLFYLFKKQSSEVNPFKKHCDVESCISLCQPALHQSMELQCGDRNCRRDFILPTATLPPPGSFDSCCNHMKRTCTSLRRLTQLPVKRWQRWLNTLL